MFGNRQHILLRSNCFTKWAVLIAMLAVAAWGIEYAAHLHFEPPAKASGHTPHVCQICVAFQAGAGSPVVATTVQPVPLKPGRVAVAAAAPAHRFIHSYRSRAPPHG